MAYQPDNRACAENRTLCQRTEGWKSACWMNEVCKRASVGYRGGRKSVYNLYEGLRHIKRGLRGVWRDHGVAAVDLCFRVRLYFQRLPAFGPGRNALLPVKTTEVQADKRDAV